MQHSKIGISPTFYLNFSISDLCSHNKNTFGVLTTAGPDTVKHDMKSVPGSRHKQMGNTKIKSRLPRDNSILITELIFLLQTSPSRSINNSIDLEHRISLTARPPRLPPAIHYVRSLYKYNLFALVDISCSTCLTSDFLLLHQVPNTWVIFCVALATN